MLKNIEAIIFDMDGVLVDSEPLHEKTAKMTLREYNIEIPASEWEHFSGTTDWDMFTYIVKNFTDGNVSVEELVAHRNKTYLEVAPKKIEMVKGAYDFIRQIRQKGLKIALTTSSTKDIQQMVFNKFHLHRYFDAIITGDEIKHGKPHPEPYQKTVKKLGIAPKNCLVIEDSTNGIKSAKAAGSIAVGITTSFPKKTLQNAGADYVVDTFQELSDIWNNV